jgi:type III secretory pathway lipoprotein EscJ
MSVLSEAIANQVVAFLVVAGFDAYATGGPSGNLNLKVNTTAFPSEVHQVIRKNGLYRDIFTTQPRMISNGEGRPRDCKEHS